jgi:formylglycine-generating enzyme required for sulfatase activity/tRNA A-37 threonylcarbamoyl transferase component Bud32
MADQFPEKLGKYKIIEEVGRGGFADVYKAVDTTLDRTVALKFLEPRLLRDPAFVERFQREAKLAANLKHPHIVFVHEFAWKAGTVYMAMEFLEGQTLKEVILQEGALPPSRIVNMVGQMASALDYAHERGLVHRDIKPSNIMVGADDHVTVMDFGIAKAATLTALTTTGRIFGTPEYMSPEQAEGLVEPDARSDVYSLGVVVYEMFTGQVPFRGTTPLSIMRGHADKPPPRPSEINPAVSPAVEAVLLKALAKKREERYQSAGEMAVALQQAVRGAVMEAERAPAPPPAEPAPASVPARPALPWRWVAGIGAAVVGVVALSIVLTSGGGPATTPTSAPTAAVLAPTDTPVPPTNTPTPSAPLDMVHVPAGEFIMGSDEGAGDEQPVHTVYLDAFYIDETEVTNAQFAQFLNEQGNQEEGGVTWLDIGNENCLITESGGQYQPKSGYSDHPVIEVSWYGANAYCQWAGKRLPTEAEWEKAARGTDERTYPWGEGIDCDHAQYSECGGRTVPVGSKPKGVSPYGALDMAGNVWEWVADWYDSGYYALSPENRPEGPASGGGRVIRGGSWLNDGAIVRAAHRDWFDPVVAYYLVGFRCAR